MNIEAVKSMLLSQLWINDLDVSLLHHAENILGSNPKIEKQILECFKLKRELREKCEKISLYFVAKLEGF